MISMPSPPQMPTPPAPPNAPVITLPPRQPQTASAGFGGTLLGGSIAGPAGMAAANPTNTGNRTLLGS
jgi:hypothetical protein